MVNINQTNGMLLLGGLAGIMFGNKLGPLKGIAKMGGYVALGLGILDVTGIYSFDSIRGMISQATGGAFYGGWTRTSEAFAANTIPYDPNNYYLPPRDPSILA